MHFSRLPPPFFRKPRLNFCKLVFKFSLDLYPSKKFRRCHLNGNFDSFGLQRLYYLAGHRKKKTDGIELMTAALKLYIHT